MATDPLGELVRQYLVAQGVVRRPEVAAPVGDPNLPPLWVDLSQGIPAPGDLTPPNRAGDAVVAVNVATGLPSRRMETELRVLAWSAAGMVLAALNPLGPRLLLFPMELLRNTESFQAIAEWQPPEFNEISQLVFLAQLIVGLLLLNRRRSWRVALPMLAFAALAFSAARNVAPASIVPVPLMARSAAGLGRSRVTAGPGGHQSRWPSWSRLAWTSWGRAAIPGW